MQLSEPDQRLHSGFTAQITFLGDMKKDVLYMSRQALFMKDGKRFAYVKTASGYEQRKVNIIGEGESRVVLEGLPAGTQVALIDPTAPQNPGSASGGASPAATGAP